MNKKQDKILSTTTKLFIKQGVKKTTMDEIAEIANVSKVTIYKYFGDKDSLCFAVGNSIFVHYSSILKRQANDTISLDKKLANVMDTLTEFVLSNKLTLCKKLLKLNDELCDKYDSFNKEYKQQIIKLIEEGKNSSKIKNEISSEIAFHYIDMGISCFQNNVEYRHKILNNAVFQEEFMTFILSNIFIEAGEFYK